MPDPVSLTVARRLLSFISISNNIYPDLVNFIALERRFMKIRCMYVSSRNRECGTSGATTTSSSTSTSSSFLGRRTRVDSQTVLMSRAIGRHEASASLSSFDQSNTLFVTADILVWDKPLETCRHTQ